jgi:uncharacterized DUF497 family protein
VHYNFERYLAKARRILHKHKVSFEPAVRMLLDSSMLSILPNVRF